MNSADQKTLDIIIEEIIDDCEKRCPKSEDVTPAFPWTQKLQMLARMRNEVYVANMPEGQARDEEVENIGTSDSRYCMECGLLNDQYDPNYENQPTCYSGGQHDIMCDRLNDGSHGECVPCDNESCDVCKASGAHW